MNQANQKFSNIALQKPPLQQNSINRVKKSSVSNDKTLTNNPSLRKIQVNANLPYNYPKEHTPNSYSNVHKREETNTLGSTSRSPINFDHQKYNEIRNSHVNLTNSEHSLTNLNVG